MNSAAPWALLASEFELQKLKHKLKLKRKQRLKNPTVNSAVQEGIGHKILLTTVHTAQEDKISIYDVFHTVINVNTVQVPSELYDSHSFYL